jgi:hypothetical protein
MLANIIRNRKKTGIGGGGGIVIDGGDPYYSAVSLMLSMDGTNGSTTFTDSSLNAIAVTPVGNAQISTTQSKYGGASAYFDGSGDAVQIPYSAALDLTSGDFTIEGWVYFNSVSGTPTIVTPFGTGNTFGGWVIVLNSSSQFAFYLSTAANTWNGPSNVLFSATAAATGTWYHFALVRNGSTFTPYLNGIAGTTATFSSTLYNNSKPLKIGAEKDSNVFPLNGYLDDLRISRFARYVSNFTPPTAALPTTASSTVADPYYNYTSLLLHMDGTNASTNFVDAGPSALTVTAAANAQISTTQSKFGAASGYFDGTGDSLTIPANSVFALGTGNYTIEGWFYSLTSGSSLRGMIDFRTAATGTNGLMLRENDGGFLVYLNNATILSTTTGRVANQWQHVALVRNGTTVTLYVDGVSQTSVTSSTNLTDNAMRISGFVDTQSSVFTYNGYMDDLRITKYARYTSVFTPPAAALPEFATGNDRYFSNVSLLLHMDGANGSTIFTDNSANALAVTPVGNAQISTTQSQFGGASAYFDGTGDYLTVASHASIAFGLGDFTIECWVNFSALPTTNTIMGIANTMTSTTSAGFTHWWFGLEDSAGTKRLRLGRHGNASVFAYTNWTPSLNTWYFLQATRSSGSTIKLGVNGVLQAVTSSGSNWVNDFSSTGTLVVGYMATVLAFNGNIDDFRTTKGIAREIALPTSAFPNA